jgi:hypothetical protein
MTHNRFARSRGDGDISDDDAPRLWLALLGVTLFGLFFAVLLVADLTLRPARNDAATRPTPAKSEEPRAVAAGKSDPLPMSTPIVPAPPAASDHLGQPNTTAAVAPPAPFAAATDDDIKQAEAERHHRRDICPKGRTYYMKGRYQYWRCNR